MRVCVFQLQANIVASVPVVASPPLIVKPSVRPFSASDTKSCVRGWLWLLTCNEMAYAHTHQQCCAREMVQRCVLCDAACSARDAVPDGLQQ